MVSWQIFGWIPFANVRLYHSSVRSRTNVNVHKLYVFMFSNGHWMFDPFFTILSALTKRRLSHCAVVSAVLWTGAIWPFGLHAREAGAHQRGHSVARWQLVRQVLCQAGSENCYPQDEMWVCSSKAFVSFYHHHSAMLRCVQQRALLYNCSPNRWSEWTHFLVTVLLFTMWIWENLFLRCLKNLVHFQEMLSEVKCFCNYLHRNVGACMLCVQNFTRLKGFTAQHNTTHLQHSHALPLSALCAPGHCSLCCRSGNTFSVL